MGYQLYIIEIGLLTNTIVKHLVHVKCMYLDCLCTKHTKEVNGYVWYSHIKGKTEM